MYFEKNEADSPPVSDLLSISNEICPAKSITFLIVLLWLKDDPGGRESAALATRWHLVPLGLVCKWI